MRTARCGMRRRSRRGRPLGLLCACCGMSSTNRESLDGGDDVIAFHLSRSSTLKESGRPSDATTDFKPPTETEALLFARETFLGPRDTRMDRQDRKLLAIALLDPESWSLGLV